MHGRMVDLQRYKASSGERNFIERTNKASIFLEAVLAKEHQSNFEEKSTPASKKMIFFFKNRSIHFHINSTRVIRLVKGNQLSFSSIEINKAPLHSPVSSSPVSRRSDSTTEANSRSCLRVESSISTDSNITNNTVRKFINV